MSIVTIIGYTIFTYLIASIPFSMVIGKLVLGVDIREYGDGNPGATNVKRAGGGMFWFIIAMLLDGFKGLFPVGIPYWLMGWNGYEIVPVALAALAGHAFSVYLRFDGGKAIAITGGVWTGLIGFEGAFIVAIPLTFWYYVWKQSAWAVTFMVISILAYVLYTRGFDPVLVMIWIGNILMVAFKHRAEFDGLPRLRLPEPKEDAA